MAGGLALGVAWWAEHIAGMVPCALCLWERWPYRVAIVLGLVLAISPRPLARAVLGLAAVTMFTGAGIALVHVGVEQGWWPSPLPECAAPHFGGGSLTDRLASMPLRPAKPCDAPNRLIAAVPVSFAMLDLAYALLLGVALCIVLSRLRRTPHIFFGRH